MSRGLTSPNTGKTSTTDTTKQYTTKIKNKPKET